MAIRVNPVFSWERMTAAVDAVHDRARRAAAALHRAGIDHAMVGGNAVLARISTVDSEAGRNTKDVDVLIHRSDLQRVVTALESAGFVHRHAAGTDLFLDGPEGTARAGVHVVFAGEKVRPDHPLSAPDVTESPAGPEYRIVTLEGLVRMKLTWFCMRDQVHLMDLLDVGLIDGKWAAKLPAPLGERLQSVIEARQKET